MKTFLKLILILIIILSFTLGGLCLGIYIRTNENPINYITAYLHIGIGNKVLTKDNVKETINEFSEKVGKESDEVYYLSYIYLNNVFKNMLTSSDTYSKMYGKTINELIKEAKEEMERDGTNIEKFKKSLKEFENKANKNENIYLNK